MTTLIGIEYDDSCVLVADSRTTDSVGYIYSHSDVKKIAERNGYLIAGSGEECLAIQRSTYGSHQFPLRLIKKIYFILWFQR